MVVTLGVTIHTRRCIIIRAALPHVSNGFAGSGRISAAESVNRTLRGRFRAVFVAVVLGRAGSWPASVEGGPVGAPVLHVEVQNAVGVVAYLVANNGAGHAFALGVAGAPGEPGRTWFRSGSTPYLGAA